MQWVIFDAWGVVYSAGDDVAALLLPFLRRRDPAMTYERIREVYWPASGGKLSAREFWAALGFGQEYPQIEEQYLLSGPRLEADFLPVAEQLAKQYGLAMLSNDLGNWSAFLRQRFDIDRLFRAAVISGDVGLRKPDRRVFQMLLERTGARPDQSLYVDDRPKNIRAAAELGFHTVRVLRDAYEDEFPAEATIRRLTELPAVADRLLG